MVVAFLFIFVPLGSCSFYAAEIALLKKKQDLGFYIFTVVMALTLFCIRSQFLF